jgi:hypothetical protein
MKKASNIRANGTNRLNLIDMLKHHATYLQKYKEKDGELTYLVVNDEREGNCYKLGNSIIDCSSSTNYRIFNRVTEAEKKIKGKKVVTADIKHEVQPGDLQRKQVRLYVSVDDTVYKTCVLRFYEITYIVNAIKFHTDSQSNTRFWNWINSNDKSIQISNTTGEFVNSGNYLMLNISTRADNLTHGYAYRMFKKLDTDNAIFFATAEECGAAKRACQEETGREKIKTIEVYHKLMDEKKIIPFEL